MSVHAVEEIKQEAPPFDVRLSSFIIACACIKATWIPFMILPTIVLLSPHYSEELFSQSEGILCYVAKVLFYSKMERFISIERLL